MVAFEKSLPKKPKLSPFLSFPRFIAAQRGRPSSHAGETCNVVGLVRLVRRQIQPRLLQTPVTPEEHEADKEALFRKTSDAVKAV